MTVKNSKDWRRALLPVTASIREAIASLDKSALQIILVVSPDATLLGTLTDGDIRRGLLRGMDMNNPIDSIFQRNPLVVPPHLERQAAIQLMIANKVHQLPVIDSHGCVVGLHILDETTEPLKRQNLMVIMAGGKGTRLNPHTKTCPKPMLPVGGKPMLEHIIEKAKSEGFEHFVLAINYLGHMIEDYFGDGSHWQVQIDYLRETVALGTAGAIGLIDQSPSTSFVVSNGDVLTDIRYGELLDFHIQNKAVATMAVRLFEWQHPFGVVHTNGLDIVGFDEKPVSRSQINAGVYVLEPEALDNLVLREYCDMPTLFSRLSGRSARTIVYPIHESWLDVGRPDDLIAARKNFINKTTV